MKMNKITEIIEKCPSKMEFTWTTTRKFKMDVVKLFNTPEFKDKTCLEVGANVGLSTQLLSQLFKQVIGLEWNTEHLEKAKKQCRECINVELLQFDVYGQPWPWKDVYVSFIDCEHQYFHVLKDIENSIKCGAKYLVFDDYGLFPEVHAAIENARRFYPIKNTIFIGEPAGVKFHPTKQSSDWEGIVLQLE